MCQTKTSFGKTPWPTGRDTKAIGHFDFWFHHVAYRTPWHVSANKETKNNKGNNFFAHTEASERVKIVFRFGAFLRSKFFCKKNKQNWNYPDNLIYNTTFLVEVKWLTAIKLNKMHREPKCTSIQMPWVSKSLSALSSLTALSVQVPECLRCLSALRVPS